MALSLLASSLVLLCGGALIAVATEVAARTARRAETQRLWRQAGVAGLLLLLAVEANGLGAAAVVTAQLRPAAEPPPESSPAPAADPLPVGASADWEQDGTAPGPAVGPAANRAPASESRDEPDELATRREASLLDLAAAPPWWSEPASDDEAFAPLPRLARAI